LLRALLAALCEYSSAKEGMLMNYRKLLGFKSFEEVLLAIKYLSLIFVLLFPLLYVWDRYISPPPTISELSKIEGMVMQKGLYSSGKHSKVYRLWVKTDDEEIKLTIADYLVSDCCLLKKIPLFTRIEFLVNNTNLYQLKHDGNIILNAHDVFKNEEENTNLALYFALTAFFMGCFAQFILSVRKSKKTHNHTP
jgi:hypothetical protein